MGPARRSTADWRPLKVMEGTALKILIVEDEPKTGDYLRQGLAEAGFTVDLARTGLDGLHLRLAEADT